MFNEPLLTSPSTPGPLNLHNKIFAMNHTDADNVKPTEECHEVHNVDEYDKLVGQLFSSRDQAWYFYKGFVGLVHVRERHGLTAVSKVDIDEATILKEVGVGTSQVMNCLTQQVGGYHNVGFTHKDLYNALQRDESGALHNLIWSDSTLRSDYTCFSDVIAFDTTYKDNLYGRPIMPTFGVNHHQNTIVFATAIIADETSQSFEWVLQNFLEAMMNKSPISVVTDGIGQCKGLSNLLSLMLSTNYVLGIFLTMHKLTLVTQNLQQHSQNACLPGGQPRNLIFNGVWLFQNSMSKSINGCESMNALPAIALKHKKTYLDVVHAIEDGISRMRMNEVKADYLSSQTKPFQITKLVDLKSHAAEIFTRESFRAFQDELQQETLYRIEEEIQSLSDESLGLRMSKNLIQSRWTKDAKASAPSYVDLNVPLEVMQMARFAALRSMSINQSSVVNNVCSLQRKQRKRKEVSNNKVEKKIRRYGYCNSEGHNKLTCPQVKLSLNTSTQPTSTDFFIDGMEWPFSPACNDNDLYIS
ncbi:hypothetical protein F3Y22_tig00111338pilonHSYRG00181 [Hibiscus syriacus]|uniref:MULE transposase domain-containing protein n=1 Tax=Hibiscus syriacus TaxID=106335 RepID=A0A6A2YPE2_HIBSY|nr:hypothetical protein F3Y22_tig00111338pilonHSYRG00181 [Hibiscus syriacus]